MLKRAAKVPEVAARLPNIEASVAIRITSDEEMAQLNRDYAGDDHATDVLSFAGEGSHLGDIAISWPAAVRQAADYGHDHKTEIALLAVHGLLHLLGWDHVTAAERREVSRLTIAALVRSLERAELMRALNRAVDCLLAVADGSSGLAAGIEGQLRDLTQEW